MKPSHNRSLIAVAFVLMAIFGLSAGDVQAQTSFADGALLRATGDSRVYAIANGRKRHIPNEAIFASYGWNMADVIEAEPADVAAVPDVRAIKTAQAATIFDVTTGARVAVSSPADLAPRGLSWGEVVTVNDTEIESYPLPAIEPPLSTVFPVIDVPPIAASSVPATPDSDATVDAAVAAPPAEPLILQKITQARQLLHQAAPVYPQETKMDAMKTLTSGMTSPDVLRVQKRLQELGYFPAKTEPNGYFGPATTRAVRAFQKAQGLEQVGRVGPQTVAALQKKGLKRPAAGTVVKDWLEAVPADRDVLLAVWNQESDDLKSVRITLKSREVKSGKTVRTVYEAVSQTPGFAVRYRSGSGVNVQYSITSPAGFQVLADRFPIFDAAAGDLVSFPPSEEVYVPYSDTLRTPEIVAVGRAYMDGAVVQALADLRQKGIVSASGSGLVADNTDPDELKNIAIIEHMDVSEFRNTADKQGVVNRIFAIVGTNKDDAFRFAGSSKGALGLAQFMEDSYHAIRGRYLAAGLIVDFQAAMADHVNAFKAMALYHDMTGSQLESVVKEKLTSDPAQLASVMGEVRAAAYNGGLGRVRSALKKFGVNWQTKVSRAYGIFSETKLYLEKFKAVRQVLAEL